MKTFYACTLALAVASVTILDASAARAEIIRV